VKTVVVKVVVMEPREVREGAAAERMRGESMPGDDVRPYHVASEGVTGEGVAAKAAVPASAAMAASTAMTTAAAMCHGAGRPNRGAERNCRSERNACHLQVHESLISLSQCFLFVGRLPRESPDCDRGEHAMPLTIWFRVSVAPATRKLASFRISR
jgi:hypothetical protein